jgi:hypothetical protein
MKILNNFLCPVGLIISPLAIFFLVCLLVTSHEYVPFYLTFGFVGVFVLGFIGCIWWCQNCLGWYKTSLTLYPMWIVFLLFGFFQQHSGVRPIPFYLFLEGIGGEVFVFFACVYLSRR